MNGEIYLVQPVPLSGTIINSVKSYIVYQIAKNYIGHWLSNKQAKLVMVSDVAYLIEISKKGNSSAVKVQNQKISLLPFGKFSSEIMKSRVLFH